MARFLLIHGSAHGAWCWRDLLPEVAALGHSATVIDLPGHGADPTPYQDVTLDLYADHIVATLRDIGAPTLLVGHSMGGYPITLAADRCPELIQHLVYLCAYVPKPGFSLNDRRREAPEQPLLPAIQLTGDGKGWRVAPDRIKDLFYHDCPPGTLEYALPRLCVQASQPSAQPVQTSDTSAQLPRSYIRCSDDRTIPPAYQQTMTQDWPNNRVFTMHCGHSPFFADPAGLARHLDMITKG